LQSKTLEIVQIYVDNLMPSKYDSECEMRESSFGHSSPFPYSALA
jgi:hypothetical protein